MVRKVAGLLAILSVLASTSGLPSSANAQAKKLRIEKKLMDDSLVFTMKLNPKDSIVVGKTFKVTLNAKGSKLWHPYSPSMDPDAGPSPMEVTVPPELASTYQVVKIDESPKPALPLRPC